MEFLFRNQNIFLQPAASVTLVLISIWALIWKGLALWQAASSKERVWFVSLLVINTAGILEIIYLFFISKEKLNLRTLFKKPLK